MKYFALLAVVSLGASAQAPYHRFYRGYTHATLDMGQYLATMNKDFFPLFPQAVPHGLVAYRPVLFNEPRDLKIPQEIALLTFKDQPTYQAYGTSEIGLKIRASHGPVFDGTKSASLVPVPFEAPARFEQAYLMNPAFTDFTSGASGVLVQAEPYGTGEATLKEVDKILRETGRQNVISLVADGLVIEYLFAPDAKALENLRKERCSRFKGVFKTNKFVALAKRKVGEKAVGYGEGLEAQW